MEDKAEVELLEQHLLKTRQISKRMTSILGKLDHRLIKLENSVVPLHESNKKFTRRIQNIDATLASIDKLSVQQESTADEGALILRGPRPENLKTYTDIIEKLNANIAFGASERATAENARLVDVGTKKLAQLYTKLVAEASSGSIPLTLTSPTTTLPPSLITNDISSAASAPFPTQITQSLTPLVIALRKMPLPSTHPSHPSAKDILGSLKDAQRGYADMRGNWARKCLEHGGRRVKEKVDGVDHEDGDGMRNAEVVIKWIREVIEVADTEYDHLNSLALLTSPQTLKQTYTSLLVPVLKNLQSNMQSLITVIKKDLPRYTFLTLCLFTLLQPLQAQWDNAISFRVIGNDDTGGEFKEILGSLRGICMRSFPEVLVDVQTAAIGNGGKEVGTSVTPITRQIVKYLNRLPDVLPAVNISLQNLGDGNWKMGAGFGKGGNIKSKGTGAVDEAELLENFIFDVVTALVQTLTTLSLTHKRPPLASIFLINNVSHLRLHLLANPSSSIDELLSKPTRELLNSSFRSAKADYFSTNYTLLISTLSDESTNSSSGLANLTGVGLSSKSSLKDKWSKYWEILDEVVERHRFARVLSDDEESRALLADEAVKLVVSSLQRFMSRNKDKDFTKNPAKYIKMKPNEVEQQIRDMYR